jgi:hypothetical protein
LQTGAVVLPAGVLLGIGITGPARARGAEGIVGVGGLFGAGVVGQRKGRAEGIREEGPRAGVQVTDVLRASKAWKYGCMGVVCCLVTR